MQHANKPAIYSDRLIWQDHRTHWLTINQINSTNRSINVLVASWQGAERRDGDPLNFILSESVLRDGKFSYKKHQHEGMFHLTGMSRAM